MIKIQDVSTSEFEIICQKKKVYCIGIGTQFMNFCHSHPAIEFVGLVDNFKEGEKIQIHEKYQIIMSVHELSKRITSNDIIFITCYDMRDIIEQLDKYSEFDDISCYLYLFLKNYSETNIDRYKIKKGHLIPKKIHYCWFGGKEIPEKYRKNIENWKLKCPEFEIIEWNETNYDINKCQYVVQAYEHRKWAFVSDYARVDIVNQYGGIYLDADVELLNPLDDFLGWEMYCGFEDAENVNWGLGFGAVKGHKVLKKTLALYENLSFINQGGTLNTVPCPVYQSKILSEYGFMMNNEFQEKDGIAIYPKEVFAPLSEFAGLGCITKNSYSIHQFSASWINEQQRVQRKNIEEGLAMVRERIAVR